MPKECFQFDTSQIAAGAARLGSLMRQKFKEAAHDIKDVCQGRSRDNAPIDQGTLTHDITGEVQEDGDKVAAVIKVPLNAPSSRYAVKMHEGEYNLGPLSQKKAARSGNTVGRKYITRAIDDSMEDIEDIKKDRLKI